MNKLKYTIALVDDKSYGIKQVKNSIPSIVEYDFFYFDSYKKAIWRKFDIILLDYYLDIDWVKWVDIIDQLNFEVLIGFSSVKKRSEEIQENWWNFSVVKLNSDKNIELENVFIQLMT